MPTITRKASASTLIDGWRSTKSPIGLAANIITATAATTAAIITPTRSTMPTAVMTESSENTRSMTAICAITLQKRALLHGLEDLARGLVQQEGAAAQQHEVASAEAVSGQREQLGGQAHDPAQ